MKFSDVPIKILGIAGSPRRDGSTQAMLDKAFEGAKSLSNVEVFTFSLASKKIQGCIFCNRCRETGMCVLKDDFDKLFDRWIEADGLLYAAPVFHMAVPAQMKAALERLGHVLFAHFDRIVPRFTKAGGVIAQGSSSYGGQEMTLQFLVQSLLLVNCVPVAGDTPGSYIGAPGFAKTWDKGSVKDDKQSMGTAFNVGKRVAELAKIIKIGKNGIEDLPIEYDYLAIKNKPVR